MTFEELIPRAKKLFYDVWISEATPEECNYYIAYFEQYPNKGNYKDFYEKALKKHVCILFSNWQYETPESYFSPEEFLTAIEREEYELDF